MFCYAIMIFIARRDFFGTIKKEHEPDERKGTGNRTVNH